MEQYRMTQVTLQGPELTDNWAKIDLWATFTLGEESVRVRGFYAGAGEYGLRFLPRQAGSYAVRVEGLIDWEGTVEVAPATTHGPLHSEGTAFFHVDGTIYHPFGTTIYALVHQSQELIDTTMQTLAAAPFNKVRMCLFPKHYRYNHNEPDFYPFEKDAQGRWDVSRPCFAYWTALERRLSQLEAMGIQADLILFHPYDRWGFADLSAAERFLYLDYALARLSAFPHVWWSLANEYDLMHISIPEWEEIEEYVAENDPAGHLLSNHNCIERWDFSRPNVTHACIQSREMCRVSEWKRKWGKPVIIDECCYEGDLPDEWGCISGRELTNRFWRAATLGGYCTHGETFLDDENEILWWARGGVLHGDSPARIAFLREVIESLPGQLEAFDTFWERMRCVREEDKAATLETVGDMRLFVESLWRMNPVDARSFTAFGTAFEGRIGDDVILRFYDTRTSSRDFLRLPEDKSYRVELLDSWAMTRETLYEAASGTVRVDLPGHEGMAILVQATKA